MKAACGFVTVTLWLVALVSTSAVPAADRLSSYFAGPLRVHPNNPRYFTDDTGRMIYLTGAHTWRTVQDAGTGFPPAAFDFSEFLDLVGKQGHNFVRLWIFEIGNECHGGSTAWQYHMIAVIRRHEQTKPKQHPIWMTFRWDGMDGPGTNQNPFRVQLSGDKNTTFAVEWFDPKSNVSVDGKLVKMMEQTTFAPPFSGNAVLYLKAR